MDRTADRIDRLPVPVWVVYAAAYAVGVVGLHAAQWIDGVLPAGRFTLEWTLAPIFMVMLFGSMHYLKRVTRRALDGFGPALRSQPEEFADLRRRMLAMPAAPVLTLTLLAWILFLVGMASDPASFGYPGLAHPASWVLMGGLAVLSYGTLPVFIYSTIRLLALVVRAFGRIEEVDVIDQRPLYALSAVTMRVGLLLVLFANLTVFTNLVVDSGSTSDVSVNLSSAAVGFVVALLAFVLPLAGIHRRLVEARSGLIQENAAAVERTRVRLYAALDRADHDQVENFDRGLTSLFRLREDLLRIPTWPWRPGTFRTFLTAVVVPLLLWITQQLLARLV